MNKLDALSKQRDNKKVWCTGGNWKCCTANEISDRSTLNIIHTE
jgi:hypothetical protein